MKKNISILCLLLIIISCICGCGYHGESKEAKVQDENQGADMSKVEIFGVEPKTVEPTTTAPVETEAPKTTTAPTQVQAPVTTTEKAVATTDHISIYNRYNEFFSINQYVDYVDPNTQKKIYSIKINSIEKVNSNNNVLTYKLNFSYIQYCGGFCDRRFLKFIKDSDYVYTPQYQQLQLNQEYNFDYLVCFDSVSDYIELGFSNIKLNLGCPVKFRIKLSDIK